MKWIISLFLIHLGLCISKSQPGPLSLPNLLDIKGLSELKAWQTFGNIRYDVGRLLIDSSTVGKSQGQGAIWSRNDLTNADSEWTIEYIFRTSGTARDLTYSDVNGLSLWLVDPVHTFQLPRLSYDNFGGPSSYDGFQFLISNEGRPGVKIFNNDGSKPGSTKSKDAIGDCQFHFLDSSVPFTIRISYSKAKSWFKVQVDNNLCFKTNKIEFPKTKFKFGMTGKVAQGSSEVYEILGLRVWDHLTEDAIDDHGLLNDGDSKGDTATIVVKKPEPSGPAQVRQSLMEKARQHREEMKKQGHNPPAHQQQQQPQHIPTASGDMREINSKLDQLESLVKHLQSSINKQETQIHDAKQNSMLQKHAIDDITKSVTDLKSVIAEQYSQLLQAVAQLNQKVIGEVREQHYGMEELSKKVDLLMANHKEVAYQYERETQSVKPSAGFMDVMISWILVPLVIILLLLLVFVYRLRHDIKHSKLL
ncbi:uncharacterized protein SPAPADRAFT_54220 [Spathaspora passalidarum NRRL Y-27907]|uniref:L-type lectin-like domain-containing protein n=1 Tax=Spathaspora passalidarum (strain NRRL Y-27907 / 11-Y1) TaxID=619300 RepID=G3AJS6_SPAPN|nr:uncharacterized protein SPAPADRAFT_54220 [Spathaspora passalidarum NRRL Y-27907]EGW33977.1 hypothetical protein SPAPADRAFT_54220 [Spathaspora passalidarum NRRL Y-27907]